MKPILAGLFWCVAWAACGDRRAPTRTALPPDVAVSESTAGPGAVDSDAGQDMGAPDLSPLQQPLEAESRERDPRSALVRLKLFVQPVEAEVVWGRKRLGVAGRRPLELERPRASGPLDLLVRAPGYLPFHTRLLTDRDDALTVRLVTPQQARALPGYKPPR
jgi:hypothetical protein